MENLGYEQCLFIVRLANSDFSELELSVLCKDVDCSWEESLDLCQKGFITIRRDGRDKPVLVTITGAGMRLSEQLLKEKRYHGEI